MNSKSNWEKEGTQRKRKAKATGWTQKKDS